MADNEVQTFQEREENQYTKRKIESCVFSGFGVSISLVWEWKSTTGRFATSRFWPFTWKTSSIGKDKVNKLEFLLIENYDHCCFCNHDSTHFSFLRVSANALYDCYSTGSPSSCLEKKPTINSWTRHALCDSMLSYERNRWKFEQVIRNSMGNEI